MLNFTRVGVLVLFYLLITRMFGGTTNVDQSDAVKLESIPIIDIDYRGKFKYVLGQVYGKNSAGRMVLSKIVVRGNTRFTHHGIKRIFKNFIKGPVCIVIELF